MPTITAPFQRRVINPLQRPLSSDLNLQAFYDSVTQSYMAGAVYSASPSGNPTFDSGFVGNSFRCSARTTARQVVVQKGVGFINGATAYDTEAIDGIIGVNAGSYSPVVCQPADPSAMGIYLPVEDLATGLSRIDIVCVKAPNLPTDVENIGILSPTASTFSFLPKPTQFTENAFDTTFVQVVTGTATGGTPSAPSVPSGYLEIGRIYVPVGTANLANSDIEDRRFVLIPHGGRAMTLEFDARLDGSTVQGFDFGNNGVHAVVRSVYETPPSSGYKYFEVYVSSGSVNPSVFRLNAAGLVLLDTPIVGNSLYCLSAGVVSRTTVTRVSALPIFEAAGTYDALIGPTVAKFVVAVGQLLPSGSPDAIRILASDIDGFPSEPTVRLNLFAQAF